MRIRQWCLRSAREHEQFFECSMGAKGTEETTRPGGNLGLGLLRRRLVALAGRLGSLPFALLLSLDTLLGRRDWLVWHETTLSSLAVHTCRFNVSDMKQGGDGNAG